MKIVTVVGARPQFIKAASVSRAIHAFNRSFRTAPKERIREIMVHTGQHYDYLMDKVFFEELNLPRPDYHLGVGSGSHAKQTAAMLERIGTVLEKEKPKIVLVHGDTNSTLAGALAAAKLDLPVAHVEAGLRSYRRSMPEEINRLLTDHLSTILFCPTTHAVRNLSEEGIRNGKTRRVEKVGDVMYDSILYYSEIAEKKSTILKDLDLILTRTCRERFQTVPYRTSNYFLVTLHRAENTDNPKSLKPILMALKEIGKNIPVILPLHPRTRKMMKTYRLPGEFKGVKLIDPVSYLDMLKLEKNAKAILTDSGGVQKEAYWFQVPCFTLREETEWVETIQSGWNVLVGSKKENIVKAVRDRPVRRILSRGTGIFGDGKASEKIVKKIAEYIS